MNNRAILDAMEEIDGQYIVSAQERLGYIGTEQEEKRSRTRPIRRIFTVALAAALVLACTLAAAMAVSPELRETVISLFQLGEAERVPEVPEDGYEVKQVTIGGQVSAQYVKANGYWLSDDGETLLRQWDNGRDRFWDIQNGELVELGTDAAETVAQVHWQDRDLTIRFRTFAYDGLLYDYGLTGNGPSEFEDGHYYSVSVRPQRLGRRTDVVVLWGWSTRDGAEDNWCWVCDVETGEVRDVLAGCGLEAFAYIEPVYFAEDLKHALVRGWDGAAGSGTAPYLVDLEAKTCTLLSELMGLDIETAFGSYEAAFCDNDTVLLSMPPLWRAESSSVWTYHIPSGTVTPTVVNEEELMSVCTDTNGRATMVRQTDKDGNVTIIDLGTGKRTRLEGMTFQDDCLFKANASRTKLLWAQWDGDGLHRLGVIDLESGEFTAFERENLDVQYNEYVSWLGDDRVVTMMDLHTGEEYVSGEEEYYLCVYEF